MTSSRCAGTARARTWARRGAAATTTAAARRRENTKPDRQNRQRSTGRPSQGPKTKTEEQEETEGESRRSCRGGGREDAIDDDAADDIVHLAMEAQAALVTKHWGPRGL